MSNNITIPSLKFTTLEEGKASLSDAYVVCVQAAATDKKVKGAFDNVWDVVRYHAVALYREFLSKAGDDASKINTSELVGAFLFSMEDAEKQYAEYDLPPAWSNYKSKLKKALESGFNLHDNSTAGFNKVTKFLKDERDKRESAADEQHKKAAQKAGHGDKSESTEASDKVTDNVLDGLSDTAQKEILELIAMARDVEASGDQELNQKLHNIFGSTKQMLSNAHTKALAALAGKAA